MVYVDQAGGGVGLPGILQVTAIVGSTITLLNPVAPGTVGVIPPADSTQSGLMNQLSGKSTDYVTGINTCQDVGLAATPQITAVRLRSYNAVGNPNWEVDQRLTGYNANPPTSYWICDRWYLTKNLATGVASVQDYYTSTSGSGLFGTNYNISRAMLSVSMATQQASLAAGEYWTIQQLIEGPAMRELSTDVHSLSIYCYCGVALKFGMVLRDSGGTRSLSKLCSIPAATWTVVQLPNIPVWASGGGWQWAPGVVGYTLSIVLACGSTYMAPANDTWQNGNFIGAVGMDNFFSKPVNTVFYCAFVQHEPGPSCTQFLDKPFSQNYQECLRYYTKSFGYSQAVSNYTSGGEVFFPMPQATFALGYTGFPVSMAKTSSINFYGSTTPGSAAGTVVEYPSAVVRTGVTAGSTNEQGLSYLNVPSGTAGQSIRFHYTADTGW
jgi:hypothetical protein